MDETQLGNRRGRAANRMAGPTPARRTLMLATGAVAACGSAVDPPPASIGSLAVTPSPIVVHVDSTVAVQAVVRASDGMPLPEAAVSWLVLDTTRAALDPGAPAVAGRIVGGTELITAVDTLVVRTPVVVAVRHVQTGMGWRSTCTAGDDGRAYCWGSELGEPTVVPALTGIRSVVAGDANQCALRDDGAAWCWGFALPGDGSGEPSTVPTRVTGGTGFRVLAANRNGTCGLATDGRTFCWGDGPASGTDAPLLVPTELPGGPALDTLVAGPRSTCGLTAAGAAWCWGYNDYGELGDSANAGSPCINAQCSPVPVPVRGGHAFTRLAVGDYHACGLDAAGRAWCWGGEALGSDTAGSGCWARRINPGYTWPCSETPMPVAGGHGFMDLAAGEAHACGLTAAGDAWCWGSNASGQFGDGTTTSSTVPVAAGSSRTFRALFAGYGATCGIGADDGRLYCWGDDWFNALGNGNVRNDDRLVPTVVLFQP